MNKGLTPNTIPTERPLIELKPFNGFLLAGFVSGDGGFGV